MVIRWLTMRRTERKTGLMLVWGGGSRIGFVNIILNIVLVPPHGLNGGSCHADVSLPGQFLAKPRPSE